MNAWRWFVITPVVALATVVMLLDHWVGIAADAALQWAQAGDR